MHAAHAESTVRTSSRRTARVIVAVIAIVLYLVDQVTKVLAVEHLSDGGRIDLVGDVLGLRLTRNPGAAFGTGTSYTVVLSVVAIIAAGVVLWLAFRVLDRVWALALGLLLAGVLGNLTDRVFRAPGPFEGHVIDFLQLPNWPIFNVADICINVAALLILVQAFRGIRLDGTKADA
jgi:signal peptidase II